MSDEVGKGLLLHLYSSIDKIIPQTLKSSIQILSVRFTSKYLHSFNSFIINQIKHIYVYHNHQKLKLRSDSDSPKYIDFDPMGVLRELLCCFSGSSLLMKSGKD